MGVWMRNELRRWMLDEGVLVTPLLSIVKQACHIERGHLTETQLDQQRSGGQERLVHSLANLCERDGLLLEKQNGPVLSGMVWPRDVGQFSIWNLLGVHFQLPDH